MNVSDDEEVDNDNDNDKAVVLGGTIDTPAFALLVGQYEDPKDESVTQVSVPLTRLPATLGRTHKTDDAKFFGLGHAKALSRNHCTIFYRDAAGGRLGQYHKAGDDDVEANGGAGNQDLVYLPPQRTNEKIQDTADHDDAPDDGETGPKTELVIRTASSVGAGHTSRAPSSDTYEQSELPPTGFFVIECSGKNKIYVGGKRVEQGQMALLEHGTTIKLASYSLYFLLPHDSSQKKVTTMQVPNPAYQAYQLKKAQHNTAVEQDVVSDYDDRASDSDDGSTGTAPSTKKRTLDSVTSLSNPTAPIRATSGTSPLSSSFHLMTPQSSSSAAAISRAKLDEFESMSTTVLLQLFNHAFYSSKTWERKDQMIGSAITLHAVRDAARDPRIQKTARAHDGVARADIIDWISNSTRYKKWVEQILSKLEFKSYQANMSKALMKAGYSRTGTTGRHVKWILPRDISPDDEKESSDDDDSNDVDVDKNAFEDTTHGKKTGNDDEEDNDDQDDDDDEEDNEDQDNDDDDDEEESDEVEEGVGDAGGDSDEMDNEDEDDNEG